MSQADAADAERHRRDAARAPKARCRRSRPPTSCSRSTAKQQFQIQNLMAAQYRAEAIEQARRAQAESEAQRGDRQVPRLRHGLHARNRLTPAGGGGSPPAAVAAAGRGRSPDRPRGTRHLRQESTT